MTTTTVVATSELAMMDFVVAQHPIHALAAPTTFAEDGICFAAHAGGLACSKDSGRTWRDAYSALKLQTPLTTTSIALSPDYAHDHTLFAGALGGVLRSFDGGDNWQVTALQSPPPFVTSLAVSPNYADDGLVFAGTMEDGVLRSWDRGASWAAWNFGLLDLNVFALALSPSFAYDDTIYVGVESGVFRSTNGGRAWRETPFPMEFAPVLSLALSPDFASNGCIWAGSEAHGLWRSDDGGVTWLQTSSLRAVGAINALLIHAQPAQPPALLALTGAGPHASYDGGVHWRPLLPMNATGLSCAAAPLGLSAGALVFFGYDDGRVLSVQLPGVESLPDNR